MKVAIIGTGMMGKCHCLAFKAVKGVFTDVVKPKLEVICDIDEQSALRKAEEFDFTRVSTDWRDVVSDPQIDLVSVATPNRLHREISIAALAAGKHVYCEKPMASRLEDAEAMAEAARRSDRVTLLGYNFAQNPILFYAKRLIEKGAIGRVFDYRGSYDEDYNSDPDLPWTWRHSKSEAGLGVLGDLTCHLVSITHLLMGEIIGLVAKTEIVYKDRPVAGKPGLRNQVDNEDLAHAIVKFRNGAVGVLASSRIAHGRKNGIRIEIHGSKGSLFWDQERLNELQVHTNEGSREDQGFKTILAGPEHPPFAAFGIAGGHTLGFNDTKVIEVAHLLKAIEGKERAFPSFADGIKMERVFNGIDLSAKSGKWIEIPDQPAPPHAAH
jgi:predicted dehydrogenase